MSGQFSATVMFVSLVAIALAANRADETNVAMPKGDRTPASIAVAKKEELLMASMKAKTSLLHTEKLRGPLDVRLSVVGAQPEKIGDIFILRGTVSSQKPLQGADFTWSLPPGVELVRGEAAGHLDYVSAEQPASVELTLRKVGTDNSQVHLLAVASAGSAHFGDSAQFNTNLRPASVNAEKGAQKKATTASTKSLKIFH